MKEKKGLVGQWFFKEKNVSPTVQFTVTNTRTLIVKKVMEYANALAAMIHAYILNKHAQAQNKSSHVGKKLRSKLIHTFETFDCH